MGTAGPAPTGTTNAGTSPDANGEIRVEELARRAEVSVDTIRFYQKRQLLPPPRRAGRIAWYGADHVERLQRIKDLQRQGFSLAVIRRLLVGELDAADVPARRRGRRRADRRRRAAHPRRARRARRRARAAARRGRARGADRGPAARRRVGLHRRRRRRAARRAPAARGRVPAARSPRAGAPSPRRHPRHRGRRGRDVRHARPPTDPGRAISTDDEKAERLVEAFRTLLPTVTTLVANHFRSVLLEVAQEHLEAVGDPTRARGRARRTRVGATRSEPSGARARRLAAAGRRQARRGRGHVRPARAALRPHEPHHLARPRPGLAAAHRRRARGAVERRSVLDLACGTGDLCRDLAARGYAPGRHRLLRRHARGRAGRRAARAGRRRRAARWRRRASTASRAGSRCATSSTSTRCSPSAPGCCARAVASRRSTPPCPPTRSCAPATRCGSGARCRCSAAWSPTTPRPTATCPRAPPTCRRAPSSSDRLRRGRLPRRAPHHPHRRFGAPAHGDPRVTTTPVPARLRAVDARDRPGDDAARRVRPAAGSRGCTTAPAS